MAYMRFEGNQTMNELQNAYYESCATYEYLSVPVPPGLFAVVYESVAFCPVTDATLPGSNKTLIRYAGTKRLANYFARKAAEKLDHEDGECWVSVLPKAAYEPLPRPALVNDDEIPF